MKKYIIILAVTLSSSAKSQTITEVQTESKTVKLGKAGKYNVYLYNYYNRTEKDSTSTFHIADDNYFFKYGGLTDTADMTLLIKTLVSLKNVISTSRQFDSEVEIKEHYSDYYPRITANATFKKETGKWTNTVNVYSDHIYNLTVTEIDALLPLIQKAKSQMF